MKKECQVVMLPSHKATKIWKKGNCIRYSDDLSSSGFKPQNIYILSDDKITVTDWFYYENSDNKIFEATYKNREFTESKECKKIIATIDTSDMFLFAGYIILPKPSEEFIKAFCKANGIWKVIVEYVPINIRTSKLKDNTNTGLVLDCDFELKVAPDNTITIYPVEEKMYVEERMYSKKEVYDLFHKYENDSYGLDRDLTLNRVNKWLHLNLKTK